MVSPAAPTSDDGFLDFLDGLVPAHVPKPARRSVNQGADALAWHLAPTRTGIAVDVLACEETPRGWREGERWGVQQRPRPGSPAWERLGMRDRAALEALAVWQRNPVGIPFALLAALEGHTRLSWADGLGYAWRRVALMREVSVLDVRAVPHGHRLQMALPPQPASVILRHEGDCICFTGFTPLHHRLANALGAGRVIPQAHAGRLAKWLAKLMRHIPLRTDLLPDPCPPEAPSLGHMMLWGMGSAENLELRLRVRPAPGLPLTMPGEGAAWDVGGDPAARQLWRRDLALEHMRAEQVATCLARHAEAMKAPLTWRLRGREAVFTCLATLGALGEWLHLEGVPGLLPPMPEPLDARDLCLRLEPCGEGYRLQGTLKGQPLASFLPALQQGERFLRWAPDKVLDLSGDLGLNLTRLAAWGRGEGASLRLPPQAMPMLQHLALWRDQEMTPAPVPERFQGTLRGYQAEGFRWMASLLDAHLGACLADDMGLGKTVQTAALLLHRANTGPALVVAPTSVVLNWQEELARFAPDLKVMQLDGRSDQTRLKKASGGQIFLASYGRLLRADASLQEVPWGTVVLDEAHAIKNPETRRAQVSRGLQGARLALTGTPVENTPAELAALMGWLLPSAEGRFAQAQGEALRVLAAPFLLRRRKSEVLPELPPRTEVTVHVELDDVEAAFHRDLLERCRAEAQEGGALHVLAALMKLRRACAHPALVDTAYRGPAAKVDLLMDRLETLREEGHRCLLFSQFTDLLDVVERRLVARRFEAQRLDGTMSPKVRQRAVQDFQSGAAEVFLVSLRAGGTGLNLTAADDIFHLDPWWNPAVEDQASDRAHRIGRTRPVTLHRLIVAGSVEERILALHARKREMVESLLQGRAQASRLDLETLRWLMG